MIDPIQAMRADGYCTALMVDAAAGEMAGASVEDGIDRLAIWTAEGGRLIAFWTIEAGSVREFLKSPMVSAYVDTKASLALFFQRKTDARKAADGLHKMMFKH